MFRQLIGITAALSALILATTADAAPPRQLQRINSIARFSPDHVSRARVEKPRVDVQRPATRVTRPVIKQPGADRIRPGVDAPSRPVSTTVRTPTTRPAAQARPRVLDRSSVMREHDTAACRNSAACGSTKAAEQRVSTQRQDALEAERERLRNKRIYDKVVAKAHAAAGHTGR